MRRLGIFGAAAFAATVLAAGSAQAKPIPDGGMTLAEVISWLQELRL